MEAAGRNFSSWCSLLPVRYVRYVTDRSLLFIIKVCYLSLIAFTDAFHDIEEWN